MESKESKFYRLPKASSGLLSFLMLVFVAVLLVLSILLVRTKLLQNADNMGMALAKSYAMEEEMSLSSLRQITLLAASYVDEITASGGSDQEIQGFLQGYFIKLAEILGESIVDPYAVVDGRLIEANPWEGDQDYDYGSTDWYQGALAAHQEVYSSDVYRDVITGQQVMTISVELEQPGDVLALDVYLERARLHRFAESKPENFSYYLCDRDGSLLYAMTPWDEGKADLQQYAAFLISGIRDGSVVGYDASFKDLNGVQRGIYYYQMDTGWTVILTIPLNSILFGDQNLTVYIIAGIAFLMFLMLSVLTIRDIFQSHRMRRGDDTIHMLGDSFYAIYRVNFQQESYETVKMYEDSEGVLPPRGDYSCLLNHIREHVKASTYQEFEKSFSLEEIRRRVQQGVADYGGDYQRRFGDAYRWVNIRTLYNKAVAADEVILCFRDVDVERRQQMQHMILLQDALDAARKSTRAKSNFFNRMSHDMRTPLNAILGYCGLAQKCQQEDDPAKLRDYIRKIDFAGSQLLTLINDILELSRLEAGKADLQQSEFDLQRMLENNAEIFRDQAQADGKTFTLSLDLKNPRVVGDCKKIAQVLNNLLTNAVKYTNPGDQIQLEVRQFDYQQHSKYQFVVEDTGIGMTPNFLEHLFDPYSRETAFAPQPTVGTGLGMPIVKSLVQQMSGEIAVESVLGEGSRFTVTLPLKAVQTAAPETPAPAAPAEEPAFDWAGRRVLLAEDNELNMEIGTEVLSMCGAEVVPAVNGEEAVRTFSASAPYSIDAILMDMQMPVMDGCTAARAIRALKRPDAEWVPIIAVTANAFAEDINKTTQAGMDDHVAKPIDFVLLGRVLQKVIQERAAAGHPADPAKKEE